MNQKIKDTRINKNLTIKELSVKLGLSENELLSYEQGDKTPSLDIITKIADELELDFWDLASSSVTIDPSTVPVDNHTDEYSGFVDDIIAEVAKNIKK